MGPTKRLLKSFVDSNSQGKSPCLLFINSEVFPKFAMLMDPWVLLSRPQLVRNHSLVSLRKKQQNDMVQPFG